MFCREAGLDVEGSKTGSRGRMAVAVGEVGRCGCGDEEDARLADQRVGVGDRACNFVHCVGGGGMLS